MQRNFEEKYYLRVAENINKIIETKNLTQNEVVEKCKKVGMSISQATLSNIRKVSTKKDEEIPLSEEKKPLKITLSTVLSICKGLDISIYEVLPEVIDEKVLIRKEKIEKENENILFEEAYRGYMGEYHVYFFPTISNKDELLHGKLKISFPNAEENVPNARLILYTGDKKNIDGKIVEVTKEYEGEFRISLPMQSGYCILKNTKMGEQCFFIFHHWHIFSNDLLCRVAVVATTSAGSNRRPTLHRLYISRTELTEENKKYIRGQLRLNGAEILISKKEYNKFKSSENIPTEFLRVFEKEAKIEEYYNVTEAKLSGDNMSEKEFAQIISVLRDYSVAPKYNKVSMKTDEFVFNYYEDKIENEK